MINKILPMRPNNRSVVALAYDGLCLFEFGIASELFGLPRPEFDFDWYEFSVVGVDSAPLRSLGGVTMAAANDLKVLSSAGTIVVPGWRDVHQPVPDELKAAIVEGHHNGARVMSICSGVFVLAATGLLDGLQATTHWRYTDLLAQMYPAIDVRPDVLYIDNGTVLTSAGSAAGLDLGIHLIRRDFGADVANSVARRLVMPAHREGGQAQFINRPPDDLSGDGSLAAVAQWCLTNLDQRLTVDDLADRASMSARTFARRFRSQFGTSPHRWILHQRVQEAQRLLEATEFSIERIAILCGFGSAATLRHHFGRVVGTSPSAYRRAFG